VALDTELYLSNRLIAALPDAARAVFLDYGEVVDLKLNDMLAQAGQSSDHAYFPLDAFVSVVMPSGEGPNVQVAMIGPEGMFPTSLVLRVATTAFTVTVQGAGQAFRIHRGALQLLLLKDPALRTVLHRYVDVRQIELALQALCMNHHTVGQRLARWLLMTRDRSHSRQVFLTHEFLSSMLGARRESVSRAAKEFEKQGLIDCGHSCLTLLDEAGLEKASCSCYANSLTAYEQILGIKAAS
jgi:CRP-like cAMP-binding protein